MPKHKIETHLDRWISQLLLSEEESERRNHKSSGKLTASMLGKPLQAQVLKIKGVKAKASDSYALRKFQRGKDVEAWLVSKMPGLITTQKFVEYRGVIGFIDALVSTTNYDYSVGAIPHEVKSVTNMKFQAIKRSGEADRGHILQACLYALAEGVDHFAIDYVASDDYRVTTYLYETKDYQAEVDRIIDRFEAQLASGRIPTFEAEEPWQANPVYYDYPWAMGLSEEEVNDYYEKNYANKDESKEEIL